MGKPSYMTKGGKKKYFFDQAEIGLVYGKQNAKEIMDNSRISYCYDVSNLDMRNTKPESLLFVAMKIYRGDL